MIDIWWWWWSYHKYTDFDSSLSYRIVVSIVKSNQQNNNNNSTHTGYKTKTWQWWWLMVELLVFVCVLKLKFFFPACLPAWYLLLFWISFWWWWWWWTREGSIHALYNTIWAIFSSSSSLSWLFVLNRFSGHFFRFEWIFSTEMYSFLFFLECVSFGYFFSSRFVSFVMIVKRRRNEIFFFQFNHRTNERKHISDPLIIMMIVIDRLSQEKKRNKWMAHSKIGKLEIFFLLPKKRDHSIYSSSLW